MTATSSKKPVLAILGPTASGKTTLALVVAQKFNCEIVNCDSRQIYREMDIGTAKPIAAELHFVPHHLFNLIAPNQSFSAADYADAAVVTIRQIWQRGKVPLLTGGTGFYYSVVSQGIGEAGHDPAAAEALRLEHEKYGLEHMINILDELDPAAKETIDVNNSRRVLRAIEIIRSSNKPLAANLPVSPLPEAEFWPIVVTKPRHELHDNIARRVDLMLADGLEAEVRRLVAVYGPQAAGLQAIGYHEWLAFIEGQITIEQVRELIIIHTRQYAKRQETWFRRRPGVCPVHISNGAKENEIFAQLAAFLNKFAL